jgi:hypothetical protein
VHAVQLFASRDRQDEPFAADRQRPCPLHLTGRKDDRRLGEEEGEKDRTVRKTAEQKQFPGPAHPGSFGLRCGGVRVFPMILPSNAPFDLTAPKQLLPSSRGAKRRGDPV